MSAPPASPLASPLSSALASPGTLPGDGAFPAGTPIATPQGEVAIDTLAPGDTVLTPQGPRTVRHVATTTADPATAPTRLLPVLVVQGACGGGLPRTDLLMPPQQLLFVQDSALPQGALAAIGALVNGRTILRTAATGPVDWVRVELEAPGLLLAAGLPVAARHDPTAGAAAAILPPGPAIAALRARLAGTVSAAGPATGPATAPATAPTTAPAPEPALAAPPAPEPEAAPEAEPDMTAAPDPATTVRALALGRALAAEDGSTEALWLFTLPAGASEVVLLSPQGVPGNTPPAQRATARRYGVAIREITLDDAPVPLDGPQIGTGFHPAETAGSQTWRWTDGAATLNLAPAATARRLAVAINDWHALLLRD